MYNGRSKRKNWSSELSTSLFYRLFIPSWMEIRRFSRAGCARMSGNLEFFHEISKFSTQSRSFPQYSRSPKYLFISSIVRDPKACFFQIMKSFTQKKRYREPKRHKSRRHRNYQSKWAFTKQIWKIVQNCPCFWSQTRFYQIPSTNWNIAINNISKIWWAEFSRSSSVGPHSNSPINIRLSPEKLQKYVFPASLKLVPSAILRRFRAYLSVPAQIPKIWSTSNSRSTSPRSTISPPNICA